MSNDHSLGPRVPIKKNFASYASTVAGTRIPFRPVPPAQEEAQVFQDAAEIQPVVTEPVITEPERKYETVFFAKYGFKDMQQRPPLDDITKLFTNYGIVHHVSYPENKQFAIIFMTSLVSKAVHQKTKAVIGDIINDMTMENRFHVSIANTRRPRDNVPRTPTVNNRRKSQYDNDHPPQILKNDRRQYNGGFTNSMHTKKNDYHKRQQATN